MLLSCKSWEWEGYSPVNHGIGKAVVMQIMGVGSLQSCKSWEWEDCSHANHGSGNATVM